MSTPHDPSSTAMRSPRIASSFSRAPRIRLRSRLQVRERRGSAHGLFRRLLDRSPSCLSKLSGYSTGTNPRVGRVPPGMADVHDGASLRAALAAIAGNFSFSWTPGARQLFAELDRRRFSELLHNPTALLSELTDEDLARALTPEYATRLGRVQERLEAEVERTSWWETDDGGKLVPVRVGVWRACVGRISLYLLDTKVEGNPDWARDVTNTLYGGDRRNRLRQELVLGIGGVRVLRALGLEPTVFHMNEGHSAFFQLERLRELVEEEHLDRDAALDRLRASTVFTTHTPVPAGNEVFDPELVRRNVEPVVVRCGFSWDEFAALGKVQPGESAFGMTPFALRTSAYANGVSKLHGAVSRDMWHDLWPDRAVDDLPITSITNGVHVRTWLGGELGGML